MPAIKDLNTAIHMVPLGTTTLSIITDRGRDVTVRVSDALAAPDHRAVLRALVRWDLNGSPRLDDILADARALVDAER